MEKAWVATGEFTFSKLTFTSSKLTNFKSTWEVQTQRQNEISYRESRFKKHSKLESPFKKQSKLELFNGNSELKTHDPKFDKSCPERKNCSSGDGPRIVQGKDSPKRLTDLSKSLPSWSVTDKRGRIKGNRALSSSALKELIKLDPVAFSTSLKKDDTLVGLINHALCNYLILLQAYNDGEDLRKVQLSEYVMPLKKRKREEYSTKQEEPGQNNKKKMDCKMILGNSKTEKGGTVYKLPKCEKIFSAVKAMEGPIENSVKKEISPVVLVAREISSVVLILISMRFLLLRMKIVKILSVVADWRAMHCLV